MYYPNRFFPFYRTDVPESDSTAFILDFKQGDVDGDGLIDNVYLVGDKKSPGDVYADNIKIMIQHGAVKRYTTIPLENAGGYGAQLFLGPFSSKQQMDMLVSIDTGGSGGYIFAYLVALRDGRPVFLLNHNGTEDQSDFDIYSADFKDGFKVEITNSKKNMLFIIDVSARKQMYIDTGIYDQSGKLIKPTVGGVLDLGAIFPVVKNYNELYQLLALQRIIGISNADTLGYVNTYLKWDGKELTADWVDVSIMPS